MAFRPTRSMLALALALAAAPALAQSPYSKTVFFGDSLTDSGHFRPVLVRLDPNATLVGRFTTNPGWIWAEHLAEYYGTNAQANGNGQGGDNYAVGGARAGVDTVGALGATPSMKTQAATYLAATGGKADANALYTVWGGANDLFAVQANPAQAQAIIGAAVTDQIGVVGTLANAGARYILVPNLPDIGLTPASRAGGAMAMAQGTALANTYNTALYGGLAQAGLKVIPLDTFTVLQEIVANPGVYGFTNVSGTACQPQVTAQSITCNPTTYVRPDAANTYVFADGVHPSTAAHKILGDYAVSVLEAPRLQQVVTNSLQNTGSARADQVSGHLSGAEQDGSYWWGNVRGDMQRYDHADLYDGMAPAGLFGVDWVRDGVVLGGFAGYGRMNADFGNSGGEFKHAETTLGLFAGWYGERAWINGQASYTWVDADIHRQVNLGPARRIHSGSVDGSNVTVALDAGYEFGAEGGLRHGPVAGVTWQKIKLDGYAESNPSATALEYDAQDVDSTVGRIGWQVRLDGTGVQPYAQLTFDHEFEKGGEATARLQTVPGVGSYAVPGLEFDRDYATVVLGARIPLGRFSSNIGLSTTTAQKDASDATLFATFGGSF